MRRRCAGCLLHFSGARDVSSVGMSAQVQGLVEGALLQGSSSGVGDASLDQFGPPRPPPPTQLQPQQQQQQQQQKPLLGGWDDDDAPDDWDGPPVPAATPPPKKIAISQPTQQQQTEEQTALSTKLQGEERTRLVTNVKATEMRPGRERLPARDQIMLASAVDFGSRNAWLKEHPCRYRTCPTAPPRTLLVW
jgi:hypothetical protein